jgi:hypothetical protein
MISMGNKDENTICVWDFEKLTIIDSQVLKYFLVNIKFEKKEGFLYFVTISTTIISFWRMYGNYRLEGFHVNFSSLTSEKDKDEIFTSLELTSNYDKIKTSFVLIGTNKGEIFVIEQEKKVL